MIGPGDFPEGLVFEAADGGYVRGVVMPNTGSPEEDGADRSRGS